LPEVTIRHEGNISEIWPRAVELTLSRPSM